MAAVRAVEYDRANDTVVVDGVCFSASFLVGMLRPGDSHLVRIRRDGDVVILTEVHEAAAAKTEEGTG